MRDLVSRHRRHVRAKVKSNHIHSERCKDLQNPEEILVNQTAQHPDSSEQQYESDNEGLYEKEKDMFKALLMVYSIVKIALWITKVIL